MFGLGKRKKRQQMPMETSVFLVDAKGQAISESQHVVLTGDRSNCLTAEMPFNGVFVPLEGSDTESEPAGIAFKFSDGHVVVGSLPEGCLTLTDTEE